MAKKKVNPTTEVVEEKIETNNTPSMEQMMQTIAMLQQQIADLTASKDVEPAAAAPKATKENKGRKIKFTNLSADTLFLNGQQSHAVKPFDSFKVSEKEAEKIIEAWPDGLIQGVYTCDSSFIEEQDYDIVEGVKTNIKDIKKVLEQEPSEAERMFRELVPEQRGAVLGIINDQIANGGLKNHDTVYRLGELVGKDYRDIAYRLGV